MLNELNRIIDDYGSVELPLKDYAYIEGVNLKFNKDDGITVGFNEIVFNDDYSFDFITGTFGGLGRLPYIIRKWLTSNMEIM